MKLGWHHRSAGPRRNGAAGAGTDVWDVLRGLLAAEFERCWRRLLRRPEPPTPFAQYRARRGQDSSGGPPPAA